MSSLPQPLGQPWFILTIYDYIIVNCILTRTFMKLNTTIALTFLLLVTMVSAGGLSGVQGYKIGHQALKGVGEPDSNPANRLGGNKNNNGEFGKKPQFLSEKEIQVRVDRIVKPGKKDVKQVAMTQEKKESFIDTKSSESSSSSSSQNQEQTNVSPVKMVSIESKDRGISLAVTEVRQLEGDIILAVDLKNESKKTIKFIYSFLEIKDSEGRILSAETDGLPSDVPANGKTFQGVIKVPASFLEDSKNISLSLTDYPDQEVKLELDNIPIN